MVSAKAPLMIKLAFDTTQCFSLFCKNIDLAGHISPAEELAGIALLVSMRSRVKKDLKAFCFHFYLYGRTPNLGPHCLHLMDFAGWSVWMVFSRISVHGISTM